ncbi:MAG TPA: ABC transporter permease [Cellulomonas sp.]
MRAALAVELLKMRRSRVVAVASALMVVLMPFLAAGFMAAYIAGGDSQLAAKVSTMINGSAWSDYLGLMAQLLSVGAFLGVGFVVSWVFGREYSDGTIGSLYALPVGRDRIAWAKGLLVLGWGCAASVLAAVVAVPIGLVIGLDGPAGIDDIARAVAMPVTVAVLTTLLALPLALVASAGRGYLPAVGALIGVVVLTQIVTVAGAGAWFPWAAPGLWSGMGGDELASSVTAVQLALPVAVGVLGLWATAAWWRRAEVV